MKICCRCKVAKSLTSFSISRTRKSGINPQCKACSSETNRNWHYSLPAKRHAQKMAAWRAKNPELVLIANLKRRGLTKADYEALRSAQDEKCIICFRPFGTGGRAIRVDHCHLTNTVRGLLCHDCNTSLGKFQDSPILLRRAAEYIEKHQPK